MDRHELAWAAGFFDGEGWAAKKNPRGVGAQINQADNDGIPIALIRFQAALDGLGRIGGPVRKPDRKDLYHWAVSSKPDVHLLLDLLTPRLSHLQSLQLSHARPEPARTAAVVQQSDLWLASPAGPHDGA